MISFRKGGVTLNTRIKEIRKTLGLTQEKFADKIGLSQNFVWMIEKGERLPSDRTIMDICREFNVSYDWLTTGEGDMFEELPEGLIDEVVLEYGLTKEDKAIISAYINMKPEERKILFDYVKSVFDSLNHDKK